jgi:3-keto-5-aminohexanoate cleavage enzyme
MDKLIITAALTGSRPTKDKNPAVPYTPEEIASAAVEAWSAGAAIVHIHVRDPETGLPAHDLELFRRTTEAIRERCDVLINLTTSGLYLPDQDDFEQRLIPLQLRPDLCSLDIGSLNFQDRVFQNPPQWGRFAASRMREAGVKPEVEVFELGHIYQAKDLHDAGELQEPVFFQLCMGTRWGIPGEEKYLVIMQDALPGGSQWSVLGVGRVQHKMIAAGISMGGHARVGLEDNLYIREGVLAKNSAEQVEWVVQTAGKLNRVVAGVSEARRILGL